MPKSKVFSSLFFLALFACAPPITPLQPSPDPAPTPAHASNTPAESSHDALGDVTTSSEQVEEEGQGGADLSSETTLASSAPASTAAKERTKESRGRWSSVRMTVDSLLDQPFFRTAMWGALVLNEHGDTMYARNAEKLLVPASNMKIVTAAIALAQLGPDFRFKNNALALVLKDTVPSDFGPMYDTTWLRNRPLRDVIPTMLKHSQNRLAEQIFKTVGLERTGSAARDSSIAVTRRQLAEWQIPQDGYIIYDGSGYDRANYLSAETITRILFAMRTDTVFFNALPVAGVDGTLIRRMRATNATGNAFAKTGSLHSIRSLSGYVTTLKGEQLVFSLICNAYTIPANVVTSAMDSVVARLADVSERQQ